MYQTTIKRTLYFEGIGLHTGKSCRVTLSPLVDDEGYIFCKKHRNNCMTLKASPFNVISTHLSTTINVFGHFNISTVEHLLSALYGFGVDNVKIDVDGPEIPVLDGSSIEFVKKMMEVGVRVLPKKRRYLKIKKRFFLQKAGKRIEIIPSRFFKVSSFIDFKNTMVGEQKAYFNVTPSVYVNDIAKARTFGFRKDVESLWNMGLAIGGSLENAVVIDENEILNESGLRFENEFVRHKILDLIGDISLLGFRILGHIKSYKAGHELNNALVRAILEDRTSYSLVELTEEERERVYASTLVLKTQVL